MKKFLTILFSLVLFPIFLLSGCSNEPPVAVKTEKILPLDENTILTHEGTISLSSEIKIFSPISGNVLEKYFEDGSEVEEGQKLFKVGIREDSTELLQKKAALAESMTTLARKISELQNAEKNSSAQEVADRKFDIENLQAEIAESREFIRQMEEKEAAGIIHAPKSGRPGVNVAQIGATVAANETLLATIGNVNPAAVKFEVSEEEKQILSASDNLKISLKLGDGTTYPHEGVVKFFGDIAEIYFDNPAESLKIGSPARVEISGVKNANALLVPESAIKKNDVENFVYIDDNKKAVVKKVLLGDKIGTYFIVKDGLKAGESVVIEGFENLREGTPLDVANTK